MEGFSVSTEEVLVQINSYRSRYSWISLSRWIRSQSYIISYFEKPYFWPEKQELIHKWGTFVLLTYELCVPIFLYRHRDMIPIRVLQSLEKNIGYVLGRMGNVREKIHHHYEQSRDMVDERNESNSRD